MTLPKKYQQAMQDLLGEEYSAYIESMQQRSQTAIRINTAKISLEQWAEICPFKTKPVPWTEKGFLTTDEQCNPAKHPYYYAGLYYIQEPSAMIPASKYCKKDSCNRSGFSAVTTALTAPAICKFFASAIALETLISFATN